jgi:hypothetical protein
MIRNGGPAWNGTVTRHAPESGAGMDRNTQYDVQYDNNGATEAPITELKKLLHQSRIGMRLSG